MPSPTELAKQRHRLPTVANGAIDVAPLAPVPGEVPGEEHPCLVGLVPQTRLVVLHRELLGLGEATGRRQRLTPTEDVKPRIPVHRLGEVFLCRLAALGDPQSILDPAKPPK